MCTHIVLFFHVVLNRLLNLTDWRDQSWAITGFTCQGAFEWQNRGTVLCMLDHQSPKQWQWRSVFRAHAWFSVRVEWATFWTLGTPPTVPDRSISKNQGAVLLRCPAEERVKDLIIRKTLSRFSTNSCVVSRYCKVVRIVQTVQTHHTKS